MSVEDPTKTGLLFTDHTSGTLKARRYRIAVVTGPDVGANAELDNGTFLVGTHQNNDLRLSDKGVSRYHLELQLRADGLKVTDLESTNGTFQGATRVGSIILNGAAKLKLGTNTEVEIVARRRAGGDAGLRRGALRSRHRRLALHEGSVRAARSRREHRSDGADRRRDRHRQGAARRGDPSALVARDRVRSSSSIAARCRAISSSPSCSATCAAPSPARSTPSAA